jgi:hypothetical protein
VNPPVRIRGEKHEVDTFEREILADDGDVDFDAVEFALLDGRGGIASRGDLHTDATVEEVLEMLPSVGLEDDGLRLDEVALHPELREPDRRLPQRTHPRMVDFAEEVAVLDERLRALDRLREDLPRVEAAIAVGDVRFRRRQRDGPERAVRRFVEAQRMLQHPVLVVRAQFLPTLPRLREQRAAVGVPFGQLSLVHSVKAPGKLLVL